VNNSKIKAFEPCVKMIQKHQDNIKNYFERASTNAKAERPMVKSNGFYPIIMV
jgi:transposase